MALLPSPQDFLRQELKRRGMTQADLAFVLGVKQQAVNQLAVGKRGISAEMAKALGEVFDVPAEYLLSLQKAAELQAQLSRAEPPDPAVGRRSRLLTTYPVRDMIKRGWIADDPETIERQVLEFFGVSDIDHVSQLAHAAKKTNTGARATPHQLAWLHRARAIAQDSLVSRYDDLSVPRVVRELGPLLLSPEEARKVPRILAENGIRFVVVETLPGAKIDGACIWLDDRSPAIALSMRLDRIDNFWFVLRHELEHVRLCHGRSATILDVDLGADASDSEVGEEERLANNAASDFCVPQRRLASFIARKAPLFTDRAVAAFAKTIQVHPGLVTGQLQHRLGRYDLLRKNLAKIRSIVATSTIVDGWGDIAPIGV